jgi:hypothetical protein
VSAATTVTTRPLVLALPRPRYRAWARWALVCTLVAAGAGVGYLHGWQSSPASAPADDRSQPLRAQLDSALMSLRQAQAHGEELERQLDVLQQRLQAAQEEVTFLRQAREARRR